jgi:citrate lyase subunit beta/citryl-CoA lyase
MIFDNIDFFDKPYLKQYIKKVKKRKRVELKNPKTSIMVPANKPKMLNKIDTLQTDIVTINLEDGVSAEDKPQALMNSMIFISNLDDEFDKCVVVRVNPLDEGGIDEIKALNKVKPHAIRVPKIQTKKDIKRILKYVDDDIDLHITIETKEALHNLHKFGFDKRVKVVYLGILDMLESLGIAQEILNRGNALCDYILSKFLFDAKVAGLYPYSFVCQNYQDFDDFRAWCEYEKSLGFGAKNCITPSQLKIANEVFSTKEEVIEKSKYIKDVFEQNAKNGITGFSDEKYGFIDEPIYKNALLVLKNS